MKYIASERELYTDDDRFIKKLYCPLNKEWDNLLKIEPMDLTRRCNACNNNVLDISLLSDERVRIIAEYDRNVCVSVRSDADNVEWVGVEDKSGRACSKDFIDEYAGCRVIKTAREKSEMNFAAYEGAKVLVKKIEDNPDIRSKVAVRQDPESQEVDFLGDFRSGVENHPINFFFYPTSKQSLNHYTPPIAAYIIPNDIEVGERVYILDIIENIESTSWNQGNTARQDSGYAVWNGDDFDIEPVEVLRMIG